MLTYIAKLNKDDLVQMNREYFDSLDKEQLVKVANNLYDLAVDQLEKLEVNSSNSSQPPSQDSPYQEASDTEPKKQSKKKKSSSKKKKGFAPIASEEIEKEKRKPGKQPGAKGFGRISPLIVEEIIPHYPSHCAACNQSLPEGETADKPYMGYYVLELEPYSLLEILAMERKLVKGVWLIVLC